MPHIPAYDELSFDSDEEDFLGGNGGGMKKGQMLIDDILEEYDAKLEQEKARKLKEERMGRGSTSAAGSNEASDIFPNQTRMIPTNEDMSESSSLFTSDHIPLENTYKPNLPLTRFGIQSTYLQSKPSLVIPKNIYGIRTNISSNRATQKSPSKVFVRISDCAQMVAPTPAPIRVRIRQGSITEMEPDEARKAVEKTKSNSSAPKSEALNTSSKLEDPFSDLPSDLLPGLYELPNLGFNEAASNVNSDSKDGKGGKPPSITKVVYEKNIHTYSKSPDSSVKTMDKYLSNVVAQRNPTVDGSNLRIKQLSTGAANRVAADSGTQNLRIEDDDGSYVVVVIPKHATVEDVMRTIKSASTNPPNTTPVVQNIVASKRKSAIRSPLKTVVKKRRLDDTSSIPAVLEIKKPSTSIKQEPKSELKASCTLAAMSMLATAEKGIQQAQVGSDSVSVVQPETEVITLDDNGEQQIPTQYYPGLSFNRVEEVRELDPESQHIEFGLFNDHTYADLPCRYTVPPNLVVSQTLQVEEAVPDAAAIVTVKTEEEETPDMTDAVEVKKAFDVKEEIEDNQEVPKDDKAEQADNLTDKYLRSDDQRESDPRVKEEEAVEEECCEEDSVEEDDTNCRRSSRLSQKKIPRWGTGRSKKHNNRVRRKVESTKGRKVEPKRDEETALVKQIDRTKSRQQRTRANKKSPSTSEESTVKWHLFASKLRCRLCEVMCHQLIDMKYHIVQVHSNQNEEESSSRRVTRGRNASSAPVLSSNVLTDFEVSALSAIVRLCPTCDKYVPETRIANHLENHMGLRVTCRVCGASFKNKSKLSIHKEHCSSAKTECKCKMCGKEYSSKSDLSMHQRFHHQDRQKKRKYRCERCNKTCRSTGALKVHVAVHFTLKPFECSDCGKGFSQKVNLEYHKKAHGAELPYQCDMCKEAFAQSVSLKTHKKKKHGVDMLRKRKV